MISVDIEVLHNFCRGLSSVHSQTAEYKRDRVRAGNSAGMCHNSLQAARKSLTLNGEMSEWLSASATARHLAIARVEFRRERRRMKEHAWKAARLSHVETY